MRIHNAMRVGPSQELEQAAKQVQVGYLEAYLADKFGLSIGTTLLVATYRLEEVEEIIKPEKPGARVEPYVGMVIPYDNDKGHYIVCGKHTCGGWLIGCFFTDANQCETTLYHYPKESIQEWPRTPSTPAVTRKVKKWVKIEHPEVPEE